MFITKDNSSAVCILCPICVFLLAEFRSASRSSVVFSHIDIETTKVSFFRSWKLIFGLTEPLLRGAFCLTSYCSRLVCILLCSLCCFVVYWCHLIV